MTQSSTSKTKLWIRILLAVSLCLNIGFLGLIGGAAWRYHSTGGEKMRTPGAPTASFYMRALDRDDRRALGIKMRDAGRKNKKLPSDIRAGFEAALDILRADEFDAQAFDQIVRQHAKTADARLNSAREVFLDHITTLSAEDRQAYADRLEKTLRKGPGKKKD